MGYSTYTAPKAWKLVLSGGSTYGSANLTTMPGTGIATSLFIVNLTNATCSCRLNGDTAATFTIPALATFAFDQPFCQITSVDFDNSASGASTVNVEIIAGVVMG